MSSLLGAIVIVFVSFLSDIVSSAWYDGKVSPTFTNSSGAYYIASKTTLKSKSITCSSPKCHIICDASCQQTTIIASQSPSLTIECTQPDACNHMQLTDGPTDSIAIHCIAPTACANATFHFSTTPTGTINCRYTSTDDTTTGSCLNAHFFGDHSTQISVDCNGLDCYNSRFHVNASETAEFRMHNASTHSYTHVTVFGSDITGALIIKCLHSDSCRENYIYCPDNAPCDLHCNEEVACAQEIYVNHNDYPYLSVNLSSRVALYDTEFHCLDTQHMTIMQYQFDRAQWGCDDRSIHCCPPIHTLGLQTKKCNTGSDCVVSWEFSSANSAIDGSAAQSLSVTCKGDHACVGTYIICPNTSCTLLCDGVNACRDTRIDIVDSAVLNITCTDEMSCAGQQIWPKQFASIHIDSVRLSCHQLQSCANVTFGYGATIGSMTLECKDDRACEAMAFADGTNLINNAETYTATGVAEALTIRCEATLACHKISASLIASATAKNRIVCNNTEVSRNATGACYQSTFKLWGAAPNVGDWNVYCNTFDCQHMHITWGDNNLFDRHSSNTLRMECRAPYSCASADIHGETAGELHLECGSKGSCHASKVRGPSVQSETTHITCGEAENVCSNMHILSRWNYTQEYVVLRCPSGEAFKSSCYGITFECDYNWNWGVKLQHQEDCYLHYDADTHRYDACATNTSGVRYPVHGEPYCCPLYMEALDGDEPITTTSSAVTSTVITDETTLESITSEASDMVTTERNTQAHIMTSQVQSTVGLTESETHHHEAKKKLTVVLSVVFGSIVLLGVCVCVIWFACVATQNKHRSNVGALLADDINDHSEDRGNIEVEIEKDTAPYVPPSAQATEMTASAQ